ncbi:hypothetical protein DIS24_g557 [Lasiodiplodia hormozganensis]|uniref:Uncharacterized protein n=1 Tax=Lasiodiplodia hormozganensis TaxID=869390 RepID=A0AA40D5S2_9PEZI|nr:hypothetical protein DIS24_g557 [Lasiodiplodia hormozganensis]
MSSANAMSSSGGASPASSDSTITAEAPKDMTLPVWGIIIPPSTQDWINAGFNVSFCINPATVKTWMITEHGLVPIIKPGAEEMPADVKVATMQDLVEAFGLKYQAPSTSDLVYGDSNNHNISSASEVSTVIRDDRRTDNYNSPDCGMRNIQHFTPSPRQFNAPTGFAQHAQRAFTTHARPIRPLPPPLPIDTWPARQHSISSSAALARTPTSSIAQHPYLSLTPRTPCTIPLPDSAPSSAPLSAQRDYGYGYDYNYMQQQMTNTIAPLFPGPVVHSKTAACNTTKRASLEKFLLHVAYNVPSQPFCPGWTNKYTLEPMPATFSRWTASADKELRLARPDVWGA